MTNFRDPSLRRNPFFTAWTCFFSSYFFFFFFTRCALWKLAHAPGDEMALQEAALGIYADLIAFRVMMKLLRLALRVHCFLQRRGVPIVRTIMLNRDLFG